MKAESKEKLLKKVKDWKLWVFGILPIVMIAATAFNFLHSILLKTA